MLSGLQNYGFNISLELSVLFNIWEFLVSEVFPWTHERILFDLLKAECENYKLLPEQHI